MKAANRILEEAAEWLVKLEAGDLAHDAAWELAEWRRQSPEHERAWEAACKLRSMLGSVPPDVGSMALDRQPLSRRATLKMLVALTAVPVTGWFGYSSLPWEQCQADVQTAKGERRTVSLPDGGELVLNTDTAVDISYTGNARSLTLHAGEIRVTTAPDPSVNVRPVLVNTRQGQIRALGTQFIVRTDAPGYLHDTTRTNVIVTRQAVAVRPDHERQETIVKADRQVVFSGQQVYPSEPAPENAEAWVKGQLIANNQRLDEFMVELGRYRRGVLRVDAAVAGLRISGVFQLRSTDQVLQVLARTLPVRISRVTAYWVTVVPV
ncbi:MAG: FecR domain-containing protein [Marinobacter sp.]